MSGPISKLTVRAVKGVRSEIELPLSGHSMMVVGDNGTGKSSVFHGLRWAVQGQGRPSAADRRKAAEHFHHHLLCSASESHVRVELADGGAIDVGLDAEAFEGSGETFRAAAIRGNPFLSRKELLGVLDDKPGDRFRYIESFLDLGVIDEHLAVLEARIQRLQRAWEADASYVGETASAVLRLVDHNEPVAGWSELAQALRVVGHDLGVVALAANWDEQKAAAKLLKHNLADADLPKRRGWLLGALGDLDSVESEMTEAGPFGMADAFAEVRRLSAAADEAALADLLAHAEVHFRNLEGSVCPVCEQAVSYSETHAAISRRLDGLKAYRDATARVQRLLREYQQTCARILRIAQMIVKGAAVTEVPTVSVGALETPGETLLLGRIGATPEEFDAAVQALGGSAAEEWLVRWLDALRKVGNDALAVLPDGEATARGHAYVSAIELAEQKRERFQQAQARAEGNELRKSRLAAWSNAVRKARQSVAKKVMAAIQKQVELYYGLVHPVDRVEEATGAPSIVVQGHGRGTAMIEGRFGGQTVKDPRWVYSDGHLDTVALCVFLALRRYRGDQSADTKVLVLDDVVLSIDLGHGRRFIGLLRDHFGDHQILMFTHNRLFADWVTSLMPGMRQMAFRGWSLEGGPELADHMGARGALVSAIADRTGFEIAQSMGYFLEDWLRDARFEYQLAIPAKRGDRYSLNDVWGKFSADMKKLANKLEPKYQTVVDALDRLKDIPDVRNALGGHPNEFAKEYPRGVVVDLANAVLELCDALYCLDCRSFVAPLGDRRDPEMLVCRKRHIRYLAKAR